MSDSTSGLFHVSVCSQADYFSETLLFLKVKYLFISGDNLTAKIDGSMGRNIRFEAFLGIASLLMLIGSLAPWESIETVNSTALRLWQGKAVFIGFIITFFATTVSYGMYRCDTLQRFRPYTDGGLGVLGSLLALIGAISFPFVGSMSPGASVAWGVYVSGIGGLLGLFSSYQVFLQGVSPIPRGFSGEEVNP